MEIRMRLRISPSNANRLVENAGCRAIAENANSLPGPGTQEKSSPGLPKILRRIIPIGFLAVALSQHAAAEPVIFGEDGQLALPSEFRTPSPPPARKRYGPRIYPALMSGGPRPQVAPKAPNVTGFPNREAPGTVIIVNRSCRLYYTLSPTQAYEYPISIGRQGFTWTGTEKISRMVDWPDWIPPPQMLQREPGLPRRMTGGLNNPLGVRALYLGASLYRIHGTNDARTIGHAASSGCFRMMNEHVMHLSGLVRIGTKVKVVENWPLAGARTVCAEEIPAGQRARRSVGREGGGREWWQRAFRGED
jgi:lipoprotein-anchoring transpeptidase ErfK/SrfK